MKTNMLASPTQRAHSASQNISLSFGACPIQSSTESPHLLLIQPWEVHFLGHDNSPEPTRTTLMMIEGAILK